jgi:ATP-binding cassette subfamily B protein
MIWISPRLTLYALIPLLVLPPVVLGFARVIHKRYEEIQDQFSDLSTMIQENLTGVRIVRAYTQEDPQAAQFEEMNRRYLDRNMDLVRVAGLFHPVLGLVSGAALVIVLWFGGLEVVAGNISLGDFVAFGIYLALLVWPMIALGFVVNVFQRGAASMGRINRILEERPEVAPPETATAVDWHGKVEFRNVGFRYPGTRRMVLEDISFVARPGETVAIVGATGSGKSTLVSLLPRLYNTTEGEVLVDDVPVNEVEPNTLRQVMGFVPQDAFLFSTSIAENIGLGLPTREEAWADGVLPQRVKGPGGPVPQPSDIVHEAAATAQLDESIQAFPGKYGTTLGERGINLSGGQKQRATLARAVARNPLILVLDDALSAVDTHTEAQILDDLQHVMRGRTSFIISHRVSAVMNADQILVLGDGRIVERGTHKELMSLAGTYASLLRRQMLEQDLEHNVGEDIVATTGD